MTRYSEVQQRIRGLVLNVPVPFHDSSFEVDHAGLAENVRKWIAGGVKVLLLTYGTSEFYVLREHEIADVTKTTVEAAREAAGDEVLVIASTGRWWTQQSAAFANYCESLGADALMITRPDANELLTPNIDTLLRLYQGVQDQSEIPLLYHSWYDHPGTLDAIKAVCALEHVVGVKQEYPNYNVFDPIAQAMKGKTALICPGGPPLAFHAYQHGWDGALTGVGQWNPQLEVATHEAMMSGDLNRADELVRRQLAFRRVAGAVGNHPAIKCAMDVAGYVGGHVRPPQRNLSIAQRGQLEAVMRETGLV